LTGSTIPCEKCGKRRDLEDNLSFAQTCIVELQHIIRELRHEVASLKTPLAKRRSR